MRTLGHDPLIDSVSSFQPLCTVRAWEASLFSKTQAAIKGYPKHDLRVGKVLLIISNLPD